MSYGSVSAMVTWLDRDEIAASRERRMRRQLRKLPTKLRKFCLCLKRVMLVEKGPEIYIRKKVCSANKISASTYYLDIEKSEKLLPFGAYCGGGRDDGDVPTRQSPFFTQSLFLPMRIGRGSQCALTRGLNAH